MATSTKDKGAAVVPLQRTSKQVERQTKAQEKLAAQENAARLAQIVNLHIAGHSLADIGASIGATAEEVDRMLAQDAQRYIRTQPALRTYIRNYISEKYSGLLDAVWEEATDRTHPEKLENSAQALRILKEMQRLHGAEMPTQTEVTIDAAPETVQRMVDALSAQQGVAYDMDIFDLDEDDVEELHENATAALEASSRAVEESDGDDEL